MTDELNKLKKAFDKEAQIKAPESAKNAAMKAALIAFEQEKLNSHQGNLIEDRQKEQGNRLFDLLTLSKWRRSMKLSYALAGGTSIAVLTLAVFNTGQFQEIMQPETAIQSDDVVAEIAVKTPKPLKAKDLVTQDVFAPVAPSPSGGLAKLKIKRLKEAEHPIGMVVARPQLKAEFSDGFAGGKKRLAYKSATKTAKRMNNALVSVAPQEPPSPPVVSKTDRDKFDQTETNPLKLTKQQPVSTFSIDVDTASYSFMRASINRNVLPPKDAVRIEEMINYFPYDYQGPESAKVPFKANVTIMPTPWNTATNLVHIGIKGFEIPKQNNPHSNLVFLLDTSGSMNAPNKLPLLKNSFKLLLSTLRPDDTISIVAYAGSAGTVLEPTKAKNKNKIFAALDRLRAGGSTAGGEGIRLAYQLAEANFDKKGVNRVILATDGDFNVGIRDQRQLKGFIERKRKTGVFLSILGFGMGNYNDALMQTLAQNGNGNASYIDNLAEARKVLVEEASSTLFTIAKDVKIQMEFNPAVVSEYRLIGYETRQLKREDFNNDKVDAGDIGSGHTVTAIYEITPSGAAGKLVDTLRYAKKKLVKADSEQSEYGFLKLRYKLPNQSKSTLIETPVLVKQTLGETGEAPRDVRFATAVAGYGQLLRGGKYTKDYSYDDVIELALSAKGQDVYGYRAEFISLVRLAKTAAKLKAQGN